LPGVLALPVGGSRGLGVTIRSRGLAEDQGAAVRRWLGKADPSLQSPRVRYPTSDPVPESARPRRGGRVRPTKCV